MDPLKPGINTGNEDPVIGQKFELPPHIKSRMKAWRLGLERLPETYIDHHERLALQELVKLVKSWNVQLVTGSRRLMADGWMDGMENLRCQILTQAGTLLTLQWRDAATGGCFFVQKSAGQARLDERYLRA